MAAAAACPCPMCDIAAAACPCSLHDIATPPPPTQTIQTRPSPSVLFHTYLRYKHYLGRVRVNNDESSAGYHVLLVAFLSLWSSLFSSVTLLFVFSFSLLRHVHGDIACSANSTPSVHNVFVNWTLLLCASPSPAIHPPSPPSYLLTNQPPIALLLSLNVLVVTSSSSASFRFMFSDCPVNTIVHRD